MTSKYLPRQNNSASRHHALLLFSVVLVFLLTNLPRVGIDVFETALLRHPCWSVAWAQSAMPKWILSANLLMLVLNSSVNFLVYSMQSPHFRKALRKRFCCDRCTK